MKDLNIIARWSTSRATDSYGENVITVRNSDTNQKLSGCSGGGYDLENTAICDAICNVYAMELVAIFKDISLDHNPDFYGFSRTSRGFVTVDGGCGDGATRKLLIALKLTATKTKINSNCFIIRYTDMKTA